MAKFVSFFSFFFPFLLSLVFMFSSEQVNLLTPLTLNLKVWNIQKCLFLYGWCLLALVFVSLPLWLSMKAFSAEISLFYCLCFLFISLQSPLRIYIFFFPTIQHSREIIEKFNNKLRTCLVVLAPRGSKSSWWYIPVSQNCN